MKKRIWILFFACFLAVSCSTKQNTRSVAMDYGQLSPKLKGITVKGLDGQEVELESLWKERRAVVAFLRHFG